MYLKKHIRTRVIMLMILVSGGLFAQTKSIQGKIISKETKLPIANAIILNVNSEEFAISNNLGEFQLIASEEDALEISHVSYINRTIQGAQTSVVELEASPIVLNEILLSQNQARNSQHTMYLSKSQIMNSQPTNVSELLLEVPGFSFVKRGNYAIEPVLRGFKYEQLNLQMNGGARILNACPNRMDPMTTHVVPEEIEKIEIIKGPFSVRYGANFGGVINLVSQSVNNRPNGVSGSLNAGYETNGNNFITSVNALYKKDKFDFQVNGAYRDFGDYEDGNGTEVPASFRTTDYSLKFGINPTVNQRVQINWKQSFSRDIDHAGLPMDSPFDDSYLIDVDYKIQEISKSVNSFYVKIFYSYVDHLMDNANRPNFMMVDASAPVDVSTLGGKAEFLLNLGKQNQMYVGIDANLIEREGNRTRVVKKMNGMVLPTPKVFEDKIWQDGHIEDVGLFAEADFTLSKYSSLNAGIRFDFVSSGIDDPAQDFIELYGPIGVEKEVNTSAHISYVYENQSSTTQFSIGRGMRTASMVERYINHFTVGIDPYEYVGNPFLNPEINNQFELASTYFWDTGYVKGTVFYSFLQDLISAEVNEDIARKYMPTTPPVYAKQFVNIEDAVRSGVELDFGIDIVKNLVFDAKLSYVYGKNKDLDEPLAQMPPFSARFGLNFSREKYWLGLNTRLVSKQARVSDAFAETETPGFTTVNFDFGVIPYKGFKIGGAVENIFDEYYYEHLNYSFKNSNQLLGKIYEPGRNVSLYVKYSF